MNRARTIRREWAGWWRELGAAGRWLPLAGAAAYLGAQAWLGGLRTDHGWLAAGVLAGYYAGPRVRPVLHFILPLVIVGVVYDAQRYWAESVRATVRVAEPYHWELHWFGIRTAAGLVTPAAWWQTHTHAVLDLLSGAAYLTFIPIFVAAAAWWRFKERRAGAEAVMWAMLWLNLAGYVAYLIYPAAPPWYVDHYGLGPAVLSAPPEVGGTVRFDALLGVHWFADYYGRNANIFGAIPSLHVGQTFLAVLYAWQFRSLRTLTTLLWLLVFFASVYLNHHYIVDGLVGMGFAVAAWAAMQWWGRRRAALSRG